ncbi:alpha/beta hydrolase [Algoriphagus boritolerans]|uniref:Predicted esterase n=1 Tax=Algoriphagus boritolerans DSM 17298 = JCM 18970 TaxID=1120964 RepID=A0A1H5Z937_9BACT|nr:alpha/beta hydrolase [Algoriphagus boritolerans]SEG32540.1 Predicted esterase [Algoriphagus boritolerans DSM 17298 = JCM 18970]
MKQSIRFEYESHYFLSQEPTFRENEIWLVVHGYGQLAEFFIRKFKSFFSEDRLFIAPEGTNYNYLEGFQGRVGANWMTKHERETAIENNHRLLDTLIDSYLDHYEKKPKINVLGFSQGAATATRWASVWKGKIDTLVLWSGGFAHDLNLDVANDAFAETDLILVLGEKDELITPESIQMQDELIAGLGKEVMRLFFEGGHQLDTDVLKKIINRKK